jgi:hypothetical protein
MKKYAFLFPILILFASMVMADTLAPMTIARLKYDGGGDWYSNPGSLENLMRFIETHTGLDMAE